MAADMQSQVRFVPSRPTGRCRSFSVDRCRADRHKPWSTPDFPRHLGLHGRPTYDLMPIAGHPRWSSFPEARAQHPLSALIVTYQCQDCLFSGRLAAATVPPTCWLLFSALPLESRMDR